MASSLRGNAATVGSETRTQPADADQDPALAQDDHLGVERGRERESFSLRILGCRETDVS